jgi:uncharacterized protein (TIGR00106 family)
MLMTEALEGGLKGKSCLWETLCKILTSLRSAGISRINEWRIDKMAVVEISVTPLGTGDTGVSAFVARCLQVVQESGLNYQLTPMGTILEGEPEQIFRVLRQVHEAPFTVGARRVSTMIKIDDRRDGKAHSLVGKVRSVEEKI